MAGNRIHEDGLEMIALYCSGCGRRRTGLKLKAALRNNVLMCPKDQETGIGCGGERLHHLTIDPEKCPCHKVNGHFPITEERPA